MNLKFTTSSGDIVKIIVPDDVVDKIFVFEEQKDKPIKLVIENPNVLNENPNYESSFIKIKGKYFKCKCGCNLFHHKYINKNIYTCNCCNEDYEGE